VEDFGFAAQRLRQDARRTGGAIVFGRRDGLPFAVALDREAVMLGRDPACDVVVDDDSASREHATLQCRGGRWVVQDISRNGTTIQRETGESEHLRHAATSLGHGDRIVLGSAPPLLFEVYACESEAPLVTGSGAASASLAHLLTPRQREIVRLLVGGVNGGRATNRTIGDKLGVTGNTVKTQLADIMRRWDCSDRIDVVRRALESGEF